MLKLVLKTGQDHPIVVGKIDKVPWRLILVHHAPLLLRLELLYQLVNVELHWPTCERLANGVLHFEKQIKQPKF